MSVKKITMFSWGFWGWGTHAKEFVQVVDRIEAARGFKPPIFVDVRIRRTGRAVNFKEKAFSDIVGEKRYVWLKGLGNEAIVDHDLKRITIKDPSQANELLDLAIEAAKNKQRVIFYCACEFPSQCHRYSVGTLLLKEAKKRGIMLEVVEWPGGKPVQIEEKPSEALLIKVARSLRNYPLPKSADVTRYGALPWGSIVYLSAGDSMYFFITGPAKLHTSGWVLPCLRWPVDTDTTDVDLIKAADREFGKDYAPRTAKKGSK